MNTCSICLELPNDIHTLKNCNHAFCKVCIYTWMIRNKTCPYCRTNIHDDDDIDKEKNKALTRAHTGYYFGFN